MLASAFPPVVIVVVMSVHTTTVKLVRMVFPMRRPCPFGLVFATWPMTESSSSHFSFGALAFNLDAFQHVFAHIINLWDINRA